MSNDIVIGKAKVIAVEEVSLNEAAMPGSLSKKTMVISRLKIESSGKTEGYTTVEGVMMIPGHLPFGKTYDLTLRDPVGALEGNDRLFKEETS
jgi:hypothetical protein